MKIVRVAPLLFMGLVLSGPVFAQNTATTEQTRQQLKDQARLDKQQAKADKEQSKALGSKQQKKADKAQDKANKQAAKTGLQKPD